MNITKGKQQNSISLNDLDKIMHILFDNTPNIPSELEYNSEYTFLVAVLLSARATDVGVNKATKHLFQIIKTPQDMVVLGEEKLKEYIKTIGLYKTKAKNIIALSNILIERFNSQIPNSFEDLISLPGIGIKSANVILNVLFEADTVGVDTHVGRMSNRLGISKSKNVRIIEKDLLESIDKKWHKHINNLFVMHGRYVCKSRNPKCSECVINKHCITFREINNRATK